MTILGDAAVLSILVTVLDGASSYTSSCHMELLPASFMSRNTDLLLLPPGHAPELATTPTCCCRPPLQPAAARKANCHRKVNSVPLEPTNGLPSRRRSRSLAVVSDGASLCNPELLPTKRLP